MVIWRNSPPKSRSATVASWAVTRRVPEAAGTRMLRKEDLSIGEQALRGGGREQDAFLVEAGEAGVGWLGLAAGFRRQILKLPPAGAGRQVLEARAPSRRWFMARVVRSEYEESEAVLGRTLRPAKRPRPRSMHHRSSAL